ncbi:MAG: VOC family protein [Micromonosporaceae bacterium]
MRLLYVLDCADPEALAGFWSAALGFQPGRYHPPYLRLSDPSGPAVATVPEPKSGKNRMHPDIQVRQLEPDLTRLRDLGATVLVPPHDDAGYPTTVLADPEGNEFCLVVPPPGSYGRRQLEEGAADGSGPV